MDSKRAKQILESHGVIDVRVNDSPVWIEQVKNGSEAEVIFLATNERRDVPLEQLVEDSPNPQRVL